jgi:hypothetical protein
MQTSIAALNPVTPVKNTSVVTAVLKVVGIAKCAGCDTPIQRYRNHDSLGLKRYANIPCSSGESSNLVKSGLNKSEPQEAVVYSFICIESIFLL